MSAVIPDLPRVVLGELVPLLRRAAELDQDALVRIRSAEGIVAAYVRLPFDVLVSRAIQAPGAPAVDATARAADVVVHVEAGTPVFSRDSDWRGSVPPRTGWRRVDVVPDDVLRPLVRSGALALKEAGAKMPAGEPSRGVSESLLGSVVLSVTGEDVRADITLRMVSALTRMGFLPRGGHGVVAVSGRWTRLAAEYGTVYAEPPAGLL
jgi:hypothetical protein